MTLVQTDSAITFTVLGEAKSAGSKRAFRLGDEVDARGPRCVRIDVDTKGTRRHVLYDDTQES